MQTGEMIETWKRWEGQLINGQFLLGEYLGGSGLSAVFVTEIGGAQRNKAAIKLVPADLENAESRLARWRRLAKLSGTSLIAALLRCAPPISVTKTALRPEPPRYSPRRNCPLMSWPSQRFQVSIISPVCITSPALAGYCMRASAVSISGNRTIQLGARGLPGSP